MNLGVGIVLPRHTLWLCVMLLGFITMFGNPLASFAVVKRNF